MIRTLTLTSLAALSVACTEQPPPRITIDASPVNLGPRSIAPDVPARQFNLQLGNEGGSTLLLDAVRFGGDANCAFSFEGPDADSLEPGETAFVRGWYAPSIEATDQIAMEVDSNSSNFATLVVPICGKGVAPGTADSVWPVCEVPEQDATDCPG